MPVPVYILCCESFSIDKFTNRSSHFNVIENIQITPRPPLPPGTLNRIDGPPVTTLVTFAVWERTNDDAPESLFDSEISVRLPGIENELILVADTFSFATVARHRIIGVLLLQSLNEGLLVAEARIRKAGTDDWLAKQNYWIGVQIKQTSDTPKKMTRSDVVAADSGPCS